MQEQGRTHKLVIDGRLPNLNDYTKACRTNHHAGNNMKKKEEQRIIGHIYTQLNGVHINTPVYMKYKWYEPNKRRDHDNVSSFGRKVIQDALVKAEVLKDDGWKYVLGASDEYYVCKEYPRIEVEIVEQEEN